MKHFTVIKIFKTFSKKEMKEFEKFLRSPFFNNHSTIVNLFCELKKYHPEFENEKFTREYLFSAVGTKKKYDDRLFRKYLSRMYKLAEEYLSILNLRSSGISNDVTVMNEFIMRDLKEVYSKKLNELKRSLLLTTKIDDENLLLLYRFYLTQYNFESEKSLEKSNNDLLLNALFHLEGFFLFNSFAIINQIISNNYSYKNSPEIEPILKDYSVSGIEDFLKKIKRFPSGSNKKLILMMELLLNAFKMISSEKSYAAYTKLKKLINSNLKDLSPGLLYYILQNMNVFCILSKMGGEINLDKELFENYKILIDNNIFNSGDNVNITLLDFRHILNTALKSNEPDWAENFVKNNSKRLTDVYGPNILYFANALLLFHKSKYNESLNYILKIKNEPFSISYDIYIMKIKIFYYQGYLDSSRYVAESLRHFISGNNKIADSLKSTFMNFIKYYKKILQSRIKKDNESLKRIYSSLEKSKNTREKIWMMKIISEQLA
ncbi:MAG TPA: hypothetical protein PKA90_12845 [Ignavibacteria bacterium]|nr:hypothetical protein [Ignavibacteria bacterium]